MPTTTNFGWTTPADTDLVKDGAAAIRTLGNGIDSSFLDLKGGTTNQVLAKNSNTDLDFKWVAAGGGLTLLSTTALSGSSTQITVAANSYSLLLVSIEDYYFSTAASFKARLNANSGNVYGQNYFDAPNGTSTLVQAQNFISLYSGSGGTDADNDNSATITIQNPNAATNKLGTTIGTGGTGQYLTSGMFVYDDSAVISSVTVFPNTGNFSGGTVKIYGA